MIKIPLIYIAGSGHCGSTLLDLILDSHSQVVGVGELCQWLVGENKKRELTCTCGQEIENCSFWQKIFAKTDGNLILKTYRSKKDFLLNKNNFFAYNGDKNKKVKIKNIDDYLEKQEEVYKNILRETGKKIIVDSSKDSDRLELLLKSKRLDITVIHLVRDGRAVTWSYQKKYKGVSEPLNVYSRWFLTNIKIEIVKRRNKTKPIFIRYENFCQKPKKTIKEILDRVELSFEPEMLNFRGKKHHQIGGNRLRFSGGKEIRLDENWKKEMPILNKLKFNLSFAWLNLIYKIKKSGK